MSTRLSETVHMIKNSIKTGIKRQLAKNGSEEVLCKVTGAVKKNPNSLKL